MGLLAGVSRTGMCVELLKAYSLSVCGNSIHYFYASKSNAATHTRPQSAFNTLVCGY